MRIKDPHFAILICCFKYCRVVVHHFGSMPCSFSELLAADLVPETGFLYLMMRFLPRYLLCLLWRDLRLHYRTAGHERPGGDGPGA